MSSDLKNRILSKVSIETYIARYVHLKAAGASGLKGLCPFHKEKTPSFTVSPHKGFFHCFGCGKGGDIFRFVMEMEGLSFPDAMAVLARFAGLEQENKAVTKPSRQAHLAALNSKALQLFRDFLNSAEGRMYKQYLLQRGLSQESIDFFQLGACPDKGDWLTKQFSASRQELIHLGLLAKKDEQAEAYDFFRRRIIFPILDIDKSICAFGGRIVSSHLSPSRTAKYINSPESLLFKKSRSLYGLAQNMHAIRLRREVLLVEGYLDVIGLWQAGKNYACAPLGTSLTKKHLRSLASYAKKISFLFDGDAAGMRAAVRSVALSFQERDVQSFVHLLPPNKDPFDICMEESTGPIALLLEHPIPASQFFLMEAMLPGAFQTYIEEKKPHLRCAKDDFKTFLTLAQEYYGAKIVEVLPQGLKKRQALDTLYKNLHQIEIDGDRQLMLEEAARLLKLNPVDIQTEWQERYAPKSYVEHAGEARYSEASSLARARSQSYDTKAALLLELSPSSLFSRQNQVIDCERSLLLTLLRYPDIMEDVYDRISPLAFSDSHAEFLWRHLEAVYLNSSCWEADALQSLEIPEQTRELFSALLMRHLQDEQEKQGSRQEEEQEKKKLLIMCVDDYLLQHTILLCEKNIEEISNHISVSDSVSKNSLLLKKGEAIRKLTLLKKHWRKSLSSV